MKNIISYVMWGQDGRYHGNINWTLIANSAIYPEFCSRFYIHKDSMNLPVCKIVEIASHEFPDLVELKILDLPIVGTQLTTWRMQPLWEGDVDILLCRDLDHIVNTPERESVEQFIRHSDKLIHGIRSYALHTTAYLAGLVGFKCPNVRTRIQTLAPTFGHYIAWGQANIAYCRDGWIWGCDQALLRDFFGKQGLYPDTMDCPQFTATPYVADFKAEMVPRSRYEGINIRDCDMKALVYSNSVAPGFTGAPCGATTNQFNDLAALVDTDYARLIKGFYE